MFTHAQHACLESQIQLLAVLQLARETTHIVQSYTLPDGRIIKVGAERFMAAEIMFRPELVDIEAPGISENIFNCIQVSFAIGCMCFHYINSSTVFITASCSSHGIDRYLQQMLSAFIP